MVFEISDLDIVGHIWWAVAIGAEVILRSQIWEGRESERS
jgi:hypothetical protein